MVVVIMRGIVTFIVTSILSGICLVFGFSPDEWVRDIIAQPPVWLLHPLTKVGALVVGGALGIVAWSLRPWRQPRTTKHVDQTFPIENLDDWRHVDPLYIWQAGCLWKGVKPVYPVNFRNPAYSSFSMLLRAAEHGQLELIKKEPNERLAYSQATRQALYRFAESKNSVPDFLNDMGEIRDTTSHYIGLNEAATRVFEEIEETIIARFADMPLPSGKRRALGWCAHAILGRKKDTPIYGKRPPSRVRRQIPMDEIKQCDFSDDANSLIRRYEAEPCFIDLEIKETDFLGRLDTIKSWAGE